MKKLKTCVAALALAVSALPAIVNAQPIFCQADLTYNGTYNQAYSPGSWIMGKTTTSPNYPIVSNKVPNTFYLANQSQIDWCIHNAEVIWSNIMTSPDPALALNITYKFVDLGWPDASGSFTLMNTLPTTHHDETGFRANTTYYQSISNFIWSKNNGWATGNRWTSTDMEITINTAAAINWNYRTDIACPAGYADMLTSLLHEMCHGLGFVSALNGTGFGGTYPFASGLPSEFDHSISDNATGSTCTYNPPTYLTSLSSPSHISGFCTGSGGYGGACSTANNNVYFVDHDDIWSSSGSTAPIVRLYSPHLWANGASVSHTYENLPVTSASDNNDLMNPKLFGSNRFMPSAVDIKILEALGWKINWTVGVNGVDIKDPSAYCTGTPNQVFNVGITNQYCPTLPSSTLVSGVHWTLWLYADDGPHIVTTYSGITGYISITALPSGHNWTRDINGRIQGCLSVYGTDNNGAYQSGSIGVGVNYAPQSIGANLKNSSEWWCYCDKAMVSFYSPGASSYQISKRTQFFTGTWSNWSTPVTVSGDCNQLTYTGLNQYDNYQFQVKAINSFGTVTCNILQRNRCSNYLYTAPNPLSVTANSIFNISINPSGGGPIHIDYSDLECGADAMIAFDNMGIDNTLAVVIPPAVDPCGPQNTHITNVTFSNVANQLLMYPFNFDGSSINVILDVKNMIPGIYTMSVFSSDGLIISDEVQIDQ